MKQLTYKVYNNPQWRHSPTLFSRNSIFQILCPDWNFSQHALHYKGVRDQIQASVPLSAGKNIWHSLTCRLVVSSAGLWTLQREKISLTL
jgi:hypothetical protein